ncbi:DUF202 domain-containing protein [Nakamurella flavida]|uniref:DUF202 domain-containing protein n=1 Tax=Nakamurella flavida TaxID=363630 RepID=A0A939C223_9ACTN|nr:DUF202 domain-containing protein [Nakamurella flavida]MBM9475606.1 DUF202 domain-containing protein [Nakamurella flavida]MDP9778118.1 putative membrane protein [Nakamurella flavida]
MNAPESDGRTDGPDSDAGSDHDDRRPHSVYRVGTDPDPRWTLANERTALAWVRTGLGLIAAGLALVSLSLIARLSWIVPALAVIICLGGSALAVSALGSWRRNERAMRTGRPLPAPTALPWLVGGVALAGLVLAGYAVVEAVR